MEEVEGGLVEGAIEADAEIVGYAVDADVEEACYRCARMRSWGEEGWDLATEADRDRSGWGSDKFGGGDVFEDKAEDGEGEYAVEGAPGRTVRMMQEVGRVA